MKIEVLFGEICNFYGDPKNAEYLEKTLPDAELIRTPLIGTPYFADHRPDMILMGAMSESTQRRVIDVLRPYTDRIRALIDDGVVFLMTGNAYEVFTKHITYVTEEIETDALGLFDLTVKTDLFRRYNGKVLGTCAGLTVTGFRSQFSRVYGDNSAEPFLTVERGAGINEESRLEGVRRNNFFGTHLLGPILPLNPEFCEYLISLCGVTARAAFRDAAMEAYARRVMEFRDPATRF